VKRSTLLLGLSALLALAGSASSAPKSPIRDAEKLLKRLRVAEKGLVKDHIRLAKDMEKEQRAYEMWVSLKFAERLEPDHHRVKRLLPDVEPVQPDKLHPEFLQGHSKLVLTARTDFYQVLDRGVRGKLTPADLAPVARRLLHYDPDHRIARSVLGFGGTPGRWVTPREVAIQKRYAFALSKVPHPKPVEKHPFPKLEAALGFGLQVYQGRHCWVAGVAGKKGTPPGHLITMAKAAEVTYAAMHADLCGLKNSVFGGTGAPPEGVDTGKFRPPLLLMLTNKAQHQRFLDAVVSDEALKITGRQLAFVSTWWKPESVSVCDNRLAGKHLREWPAQRMAYQVLNQRFGFRRPTYLVQGLARYYSAHVSGQAMIRTVPLGSQSRETAMMKAGDYAQLRALARWAVDHFQVDPPATLGLFKTLNSMRRPDNALATAFVDFLLAERRDQLIKLLVQADSKVRDVEAAYKEAFPEEPQADLDQVFAEWFQANY